MTTPTQTIEDLLAAASPEAAAALQTLADTASDKETRKSARRALYRLKLAGIVPEVRSEPRIPPPTSRASLPMRAFASAYDGAGNRLIVPILQDPDHGSPRLLQILADDEIGIIRLDVLRVGRAALADRLERYSEQLEAGLAFAEIESDHARWLIAQFREVNLRVRNATPPGFLDLWPRIGAPEGDWSEPPIYKAFSAEAILADETIPHEAEALFDLPWFSAWFLAEEPLWPWIDRLSEAYKETMDETEAARGELIEALLGEATGALIQSEERARYAHRLEETAEILRRRDKDLPARQALYHALQLRSACASHEIPFARLLVWRSIGAVVQLAQEEAAGNNG